jgi:hypothetical protein
VGASNILRTSNLSHAKLAMQESLTRFFPNRETRSPPALATASMHMFLSILGGIALKTRVGQELKDTYCLKRDRIHAYVSSHKFLS